MKFERFGSHFVDGAQINPANRVIFLMRLTVTPMFHFTVMVPEILLAWLVELQENCVQFHGLVMSYPCQGLLENN